MTESAENSAVVTETSAHQPLLPPSMDMTATTTMTMKTNVEDAPNDNDAVNQEEAPETTPLPVEEETVYDSQNVTQTVSQEDDATAVAEPAAINKNEEESRPQNQGEVIAMMTDEATGEIKGESMQEAQENTSTAEIQDAGGAGTEAIEDGQEASETAKADFVNEDNTKPNEVSNRGFANGGDMPDGTSGYPMNPHGGHYPFQINWGPTAPTDDGQPPPPPPYYPPGPPPGYGSPWRGGPTFGSPWRQGAAHDDNKQGEDAKEQDVPPPYHPPPYYYGPPHHPYYYPPPPPGYYPPRPPSPGASHPNLMNQPLGSPGAYSPPRQPPPHYYHDGAPPPYLPPFPDAENRGPNDSYASSRSKKSSSEGAQRNDNSRGLNLVTYMKPKPTTNPQVLERRKHKNAQSRKRAQGHKDKIAEILQKPPEHRSEDEQKQVDLFEQRRKKKNDRSRERALEKKEAIDKILAKPESERTKVEIAFLDQALTSKKRKNEGDRLRRERLKFLGLSNRGRSNGAKPNVTARGPLPPGYEHHMGDGDHPEKVDAGSQDPPAPPVPPPEHGRPGPPFSAYGYAPAGGFGPPSQPGWDPQFAPPGVASESPEKLKQEHTV